MMRRVVVTGLGIVSPLGCDTEPVWKRLIDGRFGLRLLGDEIVGDLPVKVGGTVQERTTDPEGGFDPEISIPSKELKKMDRFIQTATVAADEALADAGWAPQTDHQCGCTATVIASGIGGFLGLANAVRTGEMPGVRQAAGAIKAAFSIHAPRDGLLPGTLNLEHPDDCAIGLDLIEPSARRAPIDALLVDEARAAGAEVRPRTKLVALLRDSERVTGAMVEHTGKREEIRARTVAGADDLHSTTAQLVGAQEHHGYDNPRAMYWAYWPRPVQFDDDPRYLGSDELQLRRRRHLSNKPRSLAHRGGVPENAATASWGRIKPLMVMSRRGKEVQAEMVLRQRLAEQANATSARASDFDKSKSLASGGDYAVGVREPI